MLSDFSDCRCSVCPYRDQLQLVGTEWIVEGGVPLNIEKGKNTSTLLVFQSPGVEEWKARRPLMAVAKRGGTAGSRIERSWVRTNKSRENFDITNSVQCYAGQYTSGRDKPPSTAARLNCLEWLKSDIDKGKYTRIFAFGRLAGKQASKAIRELGLDMEILTEIIHPTGGLKNCDLDSIW